MNKKITFPELIESVATTTEASKRTSEMFLKELFSVISDSLVKGENVKIKNFGQFKLTEVGERKSVNVNTGEEMKIPSHTKVSFVPDKSLADAINMPFASFEAVELSGNITDDELKTMVSTELVGRNMRNEDVIEAGQEVAETVKNKKINTELVVKTDKQTEEGDNDSETEELQETGFVAPYVAEKAMIEADDVRETDIDKNNKKTESTNSKENVEDDFEGKSLNELRHQLEEKYTPPYKSALFFRGYFWGVVTMLLISGVVFYSYYLHTEENKAYEVAVTHAGVSFNHSKEKIPSADSIINSSVDSVDKIEKIKTIEEKQEDIVPVSVQYDTVSRSRYLTTMSREYYGDFRFWVYIYEENKEKIDNPNAIAPGTIVVIPSASKYGIDKNNNISVERAKAKALEIMNVHK